MTKRPSQSPESFLPVTRVALEIRGRRKPAGLMFGVCLLACIAPTRRALRIEPTIALRMD
jgi:ABC-type lipoprotein release transport system permease subunit